MNGGPHPAVNDRQWVSEVVDSYFTLDGSDSAKFYREQNIDTLMSIIPVPNTKRATHCLKCREKYVKTQTDSCVAEELDSYLLARRADAITETLIDAAAGELFGKYQLLSEETIQIGSIPVDYKPLLSGVYFLLSGGRVVYVGQAKNIKARIRQHKEDPNKVFDAYAYLPCEVEYLDTLEALYIMHLRPAQNKRCASLYGILERTKKMPLNIALPDKATLAKIVEQEATE